MENVTIDFSSVPAKARCSKCGAEETLAPKKKISETLKEIETIKQKHKNCIAP